MQSDDDFLADALIRWEEGKNAGQKISPNELCSLRPHLVADLQKLINSLDKTSFLEDHASDEVMENHQPLFSSGYEDQLVGLRYRLQKKLAEGGFAEVWLGFDQELHRQVAIKLPKPSHIHSIDFFVSEARRVARLNHPGIVPVHDIVRENALVYIISEYVSGGSLKDRLGKSKISHSQARDWMLQIADALHYAHQNQIIHRDIKPANILIDKNGCARIADFGIALSPNKTGEFAPSMGTLPYMSPEHLDGKPLDARSDLYSIGVLYHELLQGEIPYPPGGLNTLRSNISLGNVEFHPTQNNLSRGIRDILCKCLAKDPLNRFESVDAFAKALRSMPTRRHSSVLVVIVIILMILMGLLAAYWWFSTRNSQYLGQTVSLNALEESLSHGRQDFAKKNFQKAVEDFSKAIELDPNCVEAFHRRAAATFNLGKYVESLPDFDKAVNLAPANAEIRRNRALPLMHLRQFDKAIEDLEIAIQMEPSTAVQSNKLLSSIYYAKAYDLETKQKYADALEESSRAVLLNPSPMNYQQRGILYYKLMQYQKSVDDLTEAIKQAPEVPWHYEKRALSYEALGKMNEASSDKARATEIKSKKQGRQGASDQPNPMQDKSEDLEAWVLATSLLEPKQKKEAFTLKMRERNPGFDGDFGFSFVQKDLRVLEFRSMHVTDISPIRVFPELKHLHCWALPDSKSKLRDFSPLQQMKLLSLNASNTDLEDIGFLADMPIDDLHISFTRVADISVLRGKKMFRLHLNGCKVSDISPLMNANLKQIDFSRGQIADPSILKTIMGLQKICGQPAEKWLDENLKK